MDPQTADALSKLAIIVAGIGGMLALYFILAEDPKPRERPVRVPTQNRDPQRRNG